MMPGDPYLTVRAGALYITVMATAALWVWRRPNRRQMAGALTAALWNLPVILALHLLAVRLHWWHFEAQGGLLLGMPVELYLSWAWLWGAIPALAFPTLPLALVLMFVSAADLILMPTGAPVIQLGPMWWLGELAGLALGVLPAQLLSRWTARDDHLIGRACLQMLAFSGLILFVLPAVAIDGSGTAWVNPAARPAWQLSLFGQALALPVLIGLAAVQEFVVRGRGTPVPFDPPRRLVTTGVYAYVRNPMQLSAVVLLLMWGLVLGNRWVSAAAVMAHLYSAGLAGWDEDEDLRQRFGSAWTAYRRGVRGWVPRFRPWYSGEHQSARLYVSEECSLCNEVGLWFRHRGVRHLAIVPAETHPSGELTRITYEDDEGQFRAMGVNAIARALGHLHFGWSVLGFLIGLPIISALVQLVADASGAGPRRIPRHNAANTPPA